MEAYLRAMSLLISFNSSSNVDIVEYIILHIWIYANIRNYQSYVYNNL